MIQIRLIKATHPGVRMPSVLDSVTRDSEIYFGIISMSHFLGMVVYVVAGVGLFYANTQIQRVLTVWFAFPASDPGPSTNVSCDARG